MIARAVCCALTLAAAGAGEHTPVSDAYFTRTETALAADKDFLALHRGFVAYLQAHPDVAQAERAWWDALIEPTMGAAATQFDEALLGDPTAADALDAAYDLLAREPALREQVDALQRIEFTQPGKRELVSDGLRALRANPDLALRSLSALNAPEDAQGAVTDFLGYLRARQGATIKQSLQKVSRPWWQRLHAHFFLRPQKYSGSQPVGLDQALHEIHLVDRCLEEEPGEGGQFLLAQVPAAIEIVASRQIAGG